MVEQTRPGAAFVALLVAFTFAFELCEGLRLRGQWQPTKQFFHFVARFATEGKSRELGVDPLVGNAFGNVTLGFITSTSLRGRRGEPPVPLTWLTSTPGSTYQATTSNHTTTSIYNMSSSTTSLVTTTTTTTTVKATTVSPLTSLNFRLLLLDHDFFNDVYTNRTLPHNVACKRMLSRFSLLAFDARCNLDGRLDLFRTVPCHIGALCSEEDDPNNIVNGYQFRFSFRDAQPRVWYLAFVACYRDSSQCDWRPSSVDPSLGDVVLDYDIWVVNGDPKNGRQQMSAIYYLARYQFSYELRDLLLLRLAGLGAYSILMTLIILAVSKSTHTLCRLLMAASCFDAFGMLATTISTLSFGVDGDGAPALIVLGDLLISTGQSCLLLIIMLLARGWTVSSRVLRQPGACLIVWTVYLLLNLSCVSWLHVSALYLPVISAGTMAPEWATPPGFSIIALRLCALGFFALQLRETVLEEHSASQLHFYHRFAASSLCWFVSWPAIVAVANCGIISPLDRPRVLVAFSVVTDAVALCALLRIFKKSLNSQPHGVPMLNLATPVTSTTSNSASKNLPRPSSGLMFYVETVFYSIVGVAYRVFGFVRTLFAFLSNSQQQVYSPLLSANTESLVDNISMDDVSANNSMANPPTASTSTAPLPVPPSVSTEIEEESSESASPDWFEIELFSASMNDPNKKSGGGDGQTA